MRLIPAGSPSVEMTIIEYFADGDIDQETTTHEIPRVDDEPTTLVDTICDFLGENYEDTIERNLTEEEELADDDDPNIVCYISRSDTNIVSHSRRDIKFNVFGLAEDERGMLIDAVEEIS